MYLWLVLACCALAGAAGAPAGAGVQRAPPAAPAHVATTTRRPARTLDRHAAELAWRSWLQSPESGNPSAPPRRITTKSLFITPLVCPKGQRLDSDGCVQAVTVDAEEHQRILLEQLNAIYAPAGGEGEALDYGYEEGEPGPLQLTLPLGPALPRPQPLQADQQNNDVKLDKKDSEQQAGLGLQAELELLQLQLGGQAAPPAPPAAPAPAYTGYYLDKPKRDSPRDPAPDAPHEEPTPEVGQKEVFYGQVNYDPILNIPTNKTDNQQDQTDEPTEPAPQAAPETPGSRANDTQALAANVTHELPSEGNSSETAPVLVNSTNNKPIEAHELQKDIDKTKLNPETEYSDIGEAIKIISRYAEVTTDDNFSKDQKNYPYKDEGILGTRTRLQHRRNKPGAGAGEGYVRYPPPPAYPFRHVQDYWRGRAPGGGLYAPPANPRRHHHYVRGAGYAPPRRAARPRAPDRDLYGLLGLRHWFSADGVANR
ncbi:uncharacterized protein LOC119691455 [Plutella xylostella]|uniref:uncharacterized protein LOC119691455 n=1 Tax=Plutella xylostella TaxID=51655 RepID=UPI002032BC0F|nr:uncharacterized protein LOC119691455 [Plutella xylostella]